MEISSLEKRFSADRVEEGGSIASNESDKLLSEDSLSPTTPGKAKASTSSVVSRTGLMVLMLLAVQNCSKNLLMRYVMKDSPKFLTSAAVLLSEFLKLSMSIIFIVFIEKKPFHSIFTYLKEDRRNTMLLAVPASAYNLQMSLEYVALANLDAATFSVLVQTKLLFTATFAAAVLRKKLKYIQVISLVLLTVGVMLCNMPAGNGNNSTNKTGKDDSDSSFDAKTIRGITATLGIALSSGFASVYTEKVIKGQRRPSVTTKGEYGLAYSQVQLALMSLLTIGVYAVLTDLVKIMKFGLFHNFSPAAFLSVFNSAIGGLIVAGVLKYADSVLKGYATAISVIFTGVLSMLIFGTQLGAIYFMGIANVVVAVVLYNGKDLDRFVC